MLQLLDDNKEEDLCVRISKRGSTSIQDSQHPT